MKKTHSFFIVLCALLFLFVLIPSFSIYAGGSRVWKERLKKCDEEKAQIENELSSLKSENSSLSDRISRLTSEKTGLEQRIADLEREIEERNMEIARLEEELAQAPDPMIVSKSVQEVQQKEAEIIDLKMERDQLQSDVRALNREIAQLKSETLAMKRENERLSQDKQNLTQQNQSLAQQNQKLTNKNDELYEALEVYEGIQRESIELMDLIYERLRDELSEEIRQGKVRVYKATLGVVVDVTAEHIFDVGSVEVNPGGRTILLKLGKLLRELSGNYFIGVIGNADSKPIVTPALKKKYPTNWELSAARGATVVRNLIDISRLSPGKFVSMGLGQYQPITTNATVEGRGKNRRIDIALLPIDVLSAIIVGAEVQ